MSLVVKSVFIKCKTIVPIEFLYSHMGARKGYKASQSFEMVIILVGVWYLVLVITQVGLLRK